MLFLEFVRVVPATPAPARTKQGPQCERYFQRGCQGARKWRLVNSSRGLAGAFQPKSNPQFQRTVENSGPKVCQHSPCFVDCDHKDKAFFGLRACEGTAWRIEVKSPIVRPDPHLRWQVFSCRILNQHFFELCYKASHSCLVLAVSSKAEKETHVALQHFCKQQFWPISS